MPANWIQKMNESNSRKHKEKVIEQACSSKKLGDLTANNFLVGAWYAYNPFLTYNIKQIPETLGYTNKPNPWNDFFDLVKDLSMRTYTGYAAIEKVDEMSEQFDSEHWNDFARRVILKDLRVGATLKTFNKFMPKELKIPIFECQLATDSEKHQKKLVGDKFIQCKLDGVRVITIVDKFGNVEIFSRNGKKFENFGHIAEQISKIAGPICHSIQAQKVVLDGEIMSEDFQALMKQARRKYDADASDSVYHIFDMINHGAFVKGKSQVEQHIRQQILDSIKPTIMSQPNLFVEDYLRVNLNLVEGHDQMRRYADDAVANGFEGIMIKDATAPYQCKRSTAWLKWKPVITVDLEVVDVEEGTGRNVGRLGALVCEGVDAGKRIKVNVGSGLTDTNRNEFWNSRGSIIGQIVEVKADAVTQNQDGTYSLRFPRFIRFRSDENGEKL